MTILHKLIRRLPLIGRSRARIPEGRRVYAIGDIHGRLDLLNQMIGLLEEDDRARVDARTVIIFLGDLVDRGPDSRGVVERLMTFKRERANVRFLLGNHEEVFLRAAGGDVGATRFLTRIGGRETLLSYGVSEDVYQKSSFEELTALLAHEVPADHIAFISAFEDWITVGDYLFVHAGIRPRVPIEEQTSKDLRWIRDEFLTSREDHGKLVIHGHSISDNAVLLKNRIGIDTGAFASGRLTAIGLEQNSHWLLST